MHKPVSAVEVRLWERRVGAVALDPRTGYYAFEYDPAFVKQGIELAPLTMPLAQASEPFIFTNLPTPTFKRLPALLADALPDDFGNALADWPKYAKEAGLGNDLMQSIAADFRPLGRG